MSDSQPPVKRYRREERKESSSENEWNADSDDESGKKPDFKPYVPVRERRKQQLVKLGRLAQVKESEDKKNLSGLSSGASSGTCNIKYYRKVLSYFKKCHLPKVLTIIFCNYKYNKMSLDSLIHITQCILWRIAIPNHISWHLDTKHTQFCAILTCILSHRCWRQSRGRR